MNIEQIITAATSAAASYLATLPDLRLELTAAITQAYGQMVADWRGFGLTDAPFKQYETAFGMELVRLSQPGQ